MPRARIFGIARLCLGVLPFVLAACDGETPPREQETQTMDAQVVAAVVNPEGVLDELKPGQLEDGALPDGPSMLLDDFEDDVPALSQIVVDLTAHFGTEGAGDGWYAFANLETEMTNPEGTHVVTYEEGVANGTELNSSAMMGAWGVESDGLGTKLDYQSPAYPYAGVGTSFLGEWNTSFFDFTGLVALSFKAKGVGIWRADLLSDRVQNGYPEGDNWGFHGSDFVLSDDWTQYVLRAEDFTVNSWSPSATDNLTWDDVKEAIFALQFSVSSSYGEGAHESLEFYVDDIRFHGFELEGMTLVAPTASP